MAFRPFGNRFTLEAPLPPAAVKTIIRSRWKGWFEAKNGARGWIVGPFICLWFSAFDKHGPMLLGIVSPIARGTQIRGRAGADLNGLFMFSLVGLLMLGFGAALALRGDREAVSVLLGTGILIPMAVLFFWWAHTERREAEPLVRFLRDCIEREATRQRKEPTYSIAAVFELIADDITLPGPVTPQAIHDALLDIGTGDILILASAPEDYIQTIGQDGGYRVEKRSGSAERHFHAQSARSGEDAPTSEILDFEEALALFLAHACRIDDPPFVRWTRVNFGELRTET